MSLCQVEDGDPSLVGRLPVQSRLGLQEAPRHPGQQPATGGQALLGAGLVAVVDGPVEGGPPAGVHQGGLAALLEEHLGEER